MTDEKCVEVFGNEDLSVCIMQYMSIKSLAQVSKVCSALRDARYAYRDKCFINWRNSFVYIHVQLKHVMHELYTDKYGVVRAVNFVTQERRGIDRRSAIRMLEASNGNVLYCLDTEF